MGMVKEDDGGGGGSKEESCIIDSECESVDDEEHEKDETFITNPYMCEHSVEHYYYLLPRARRSKIFTRKKPPTLIPSQSSSQEKGLEIRNSLKRKTKKIVDEDISMEKKKTENLFDERQSKLEDGEKKRRKIKQIIGPPVLPDELKEKISGMGVQISQVKLVIQKALYETDLSYKHMRLSIPVSQVVSKDFLTPQQKMVLETKDFVSNKKSKIQFSLIEPSLEETKINLAKWDMSNSSSYVLLNDWMQVVERNNLKSRMVVQLWSFHQHLVPWLALVSVRQ